MLVGESVPYDSFSFADGTRSDDVLALVSGDSVSESGTRPVGLPFGSLPIEMCGELLAVEEAGANAFFTWHVSAFSSNPRRSDPQLLLIGGSGQSNFSFGYLTLYFLHDRSVTSIRVGFFITKSHYTSLYIPPIHHG